MATRLSRLTVRGLRCLDGMELDFDPLTALIGANGAGKSSTLRAIQFLFGDVDLDEGDCTDGRADGDVSVTGTFTDLPAEWTERLGPWLTSTGDLELTRSRVQALEGPPVVRWSCMRAQAPGFAAVRLAMSSGDTADQLKALWASARDASGNLLPAWPNKPRVLETLNAYEADNADRVTERSVDHSLRFGRGGAHDLAEMVELLVLPAMRDAADDAGDSRGSTLARLVEVTIRSRMDLSDRLAELSERTSDEYSRLLEEVTGPRLADLSQEITGQLSAFAPGASVSLTWDPKIPALTPPPVRARLVESGHEAEIGRQGHGVQRAYVFSLLRALLTARRTEGGPRPGLLLAVEEPEVYQHPLRARYVAGVLANLASDTAQSTQVVYTTHSPYFVSVDNVPSVRLLRLTSTGIEGEPFRTRAAAASLAGIAARLDEARNGSGKSWTEERVAAQLPGLLGTAVSEGLFADAVVLVEGEEDIGLIDGAASAAGVDLAELGVALIPVGGKDPLPLAAEVFRALCVPTYVVFDTDEKPAGQASDPGALRLNSVLTWLADGRAQERPVTQVGDEWAAGVPTLRAVLDRDVGAEAVRAAYAETARVMGLPESTSKNGHLVRSAVVALYASGARSYTLDALVKAVAALVLRPSASTDSCEIGHPPAGLSDSPDTV